VAVTSTMIALGTPAPDFSLPDVASGEAASLSDFTGDGLLVMFICNHCPYVRHLQQGLVDLSRDYENGPLDMVGIASNDPAAYPDDAPDRLAETAQRLGYRFPLLFDETQEVARAYSAVCTPDFFLFDRDHLLVYRGQFDSSRPANGVPVTGADLRVAIDALLAGRPIHIDQRPSMGCSIKWRES
jgi:peroxiredoxin